jgi:2-keto-4-pentenoate hydratase
MALRLWGEHRDRTPFEPLAGLSGRPLAEAYDVQDELVKLMIPLLGPSRGYKIGLTSPRMQQMCGLDQPVAGGILERRIHRTEARLAVADFVRLGIESELCILLGADLPLQAWPHTREQVARSIGSVAAAFELVDDRGADYSRLDAHSLIADNSWNAGVVLGEPMPLGGHCAGVDVGALDGVLFVNDRPIDRGNSADALSHPFEVVRWLSEHLRDRGSHLRAGDLVMTGSIVPTRFAVAGEHYRFELAGLPAVELWVA